MLAAAAAAEAADAGAWLPPYKVCTSAKLLRIGPRADQTDCRSVPLRVCRLLAFVLVNWCGSVATDRLIARAEMTARKSLHVE